MQTDNSKPASETFYSGALGRITRTMPVLTAIFAVVCLLRFGWLIGLGFVVGCAIAYLNFYWLKRVVVALGDRITSGGRHESGKGVLLRFLLRYALIAIAAYVIFKVSATSLYGLLAGLFLPVAAIACEAVYEVWVALRRGV